MEQRFDGASFQYSLDNGSSWANVGSFADASNCLNTNWFNFSSITYLNLATVKEGWSGNKQVTTGSCRGGNGSSGWLTAKHTMPNLAGKPAVIFRFIFGAGTICNNYDGFAIDDIQISEAPANTAGFTYTCNSPTKINFTNTSTPCPGTIVWDFDDPNSGANNSSNLLSPVHDFSGPGTYTVTLSVSGPGNAPSNTSQTITILGLDVIQLNPADCQTNTGGSLSVNVTGTTGPLNYSWNSNPVQRNATATNLGVGNYTVTVSGANACTNTAAGIVLPDASCTDIYFPSAFTPNNNGRNERFGALGSIAAVSNYQLQVYNRWGQRVFYTIDPFTKWDGRTRGLAADGNIFTWFAEYQLPGREKQFRKGTVLLIR
jgi:gliding motility-associated-like protein